MSSENNIRKLSRVNEAGNYTKPTHGTNAGQWSARKAQLLAKKYKEAGGGYKD